jgi:hypothetical protein
LRQQLDGYFGQIYVYSFKFVNFIPGTKIYII